MKRIVMALAGMAALVGSAQAADVYTPGSYTQDNVEVVRPFSHTGFYIGGLAGVTAYNHTLEAGDGFFEFDGISSTGITGCGIAGYQQQIGRIVVGGEGRYCFSNASTDYEFGPFEGSVIELDDSYGIYGKLAVAYEKWMFGGLFGGKWQHYKITSALGGDEDTVFGWSGGAFLENAIDSNWKLGAEILFTGYEKEGDSEFGVDSTEITSGLRLTYTIQ